MTCRLTPLLSSPYFAESQEIGVVRIVPLLPREGGIQGLHHDVLAVVCLPVHLRLLMAPPLEEPSQFPTEREINMQHKKMMRSCQHIMLAMYKLVHGEELETPTLIALRNPHTQGEITFSGLIHSRECGKSTMTPKIT
jgi:hypothetical protein